MYSNGVAEAARSRTDVGGRFEPRLATRVKLLRTFL